MLRLAYLALILLGGCSAEVLGPLPLQITIEASRATAAPGVPISFEVAARGGQLVGITTSYGDGTEDHHGTSGARTARVTFHHAFSAPGTYQVQATVIDALAGPKDATISVRVD